ncbi:hypothetical protein ACF0H5_016185 [Mactra antiquata]
MNHNMKKKFSCPKLDLRKITILEVLCKPDSDHFYNDQIIYDYSIIKCIGSSQVVKDFWTEVIKLENDLYALARYDFCELVSCKTQTNKLNSMLKTQFRSQVIMHIYLKAMPNISIQP